MTRSWPPSRTGWDRAMTDPAPEALPPPEANPDLIGHADAEQAFLDAYGSGRMPHAWLIGGPRGIGKATLAFRCARFLLAQGAGGDLFGPPTSLAIDQNDPVFARIAAAGHGNLKVLQRTEDPKTKRLRTQIRVDEVRGLIPFFGMTAAEDAWRIAIIDSVDDMSRSADNALLKLLEEPPARSLLLLVAHVPGAVLPTIRSRCRKLMLKPLPATDVTAILAPAFPDLSPQDLGLLTELAEGSPGRAADLAREGGLELYQEMTALLRGLPDLDIPKLHALGDRCARQPSGEINFRVLTGLLSWWLAQAVRQAVGAGTGAMAEEGGWTGRLVARGAAPWLKAWDTLNYQVERCNAVNLDRKLVVLNLFHALQAAART